MIKLISKIFTIVTFAAVFSSCDVLESDTDLQKPTTVVTDKEVYVRSGGSVLIDLNSKVQTNQAVTLEVTSQTRNGALSDLGRGLLQYSPNAGMLRDAFNFTVYDKNNNTIKQDSVVIIIEDDSANLPCGFYPSNDFVHRNSLQFTVKIDVLDNDIFCGYNSDELKVTIYQPDSSSHTYPYAGTASVLANSEIEYTTGSSFAGNDRFIYKVQVHNNASIFAYGIVYISAAPPCNPYLNDDFYSFALDTISLDGGIKLPVFSNDELCKGTASAIYIYRISKQPHHGAVSIDLNGIVYNPDDLSPGENRLDSMQYEVCIDANCLSARTRVYLKN